MRAHDFHALCELAYAQAGIKLGDEKRALA